MNQKAFWAVLSAATLGGFAGLFIKSMSISPASQAWLRMTVPALATAAWLWGSGITLFRGNWKKMLFASVLSTLRLLLFFVAYVYTSIGNAVILFYTFPIFSAILGHLLLREKVSKKQSLLLVLAFSGIILAFSNKEFSFVDRDFLGMIASVGAALLYAYTVILFKSESKNYTQTELLFYQNFAGVFLLFPFFEFARATPLDYGLGISYGILIGIVAYSFFFYGLIRLSASTASALMYMEVVSAICLSYWWLGDVLSIPMMIGGTMIVASSFLLRLEKAT